MTVEIFDPCDPPPNAWPEGDSLARRYIEGIAACGVSAMIANVRTRWMALRSGNRVFPLTVNDREVGDSYVCLPHSAYVLYAREELDLVDVGRLKPLLRLLLAVFDRLLLAAGLNRIVHVDNWLLSTNLHDDWTGEDIRDIRQALTRRFPDHILAIRSLDAWSCPALLAAVRQDGWTLVPSRQVWVTHDPEQQWRPCKATREDHRKLARSGLAIDEMETLSDEDAQRIADLYHLLYVGKYSALNPVLRPAWIQMTHKQKILRYRGIRGPDGTLLAVAGSLIRGDILTSPVVGYETSLPQSDGLYRMASYLFADLAGRLGLRLNGSAGAARFKRLRGAIGEIEYWAMYVGHLSLWRRTCIRLLAFLLERLAVPLMKRRGL